MWDKIKHTTLSHEPWVNTKTPLANLHMLNQNWVRLIGTQHTKKKKLPIVDHWCPSLMTYFLVGSYPLNQCWFFWGKIWQNFNLKIMTLTYTKDFSLKKRNPNLPDFKEKNPNLQNFYHKFQEVAKDIERFWF
jgi:hypothetical protein